MKILLINNFHYRKGGSEAVYFNTADLLKSHGHKVVFFSFDDDKNVACEQHQYFVARNSGVKGLTDYFYNRRAARKLEELIKVEKPDIAHVHLFFGGLSPSILRALKKFGIPIVHTCHDYRLVCPGYTFIDGKGNECERCRDWNYYQCALNRCAKGSLVRSLVMAAEMYFRQLFNNPLQYIDGFIFVSHFSEGKHIQHQMEYRNKKHIVLYNYTTPYFEPSLTNKENYFLFYGRLSYEKGIPTLLNVFGAHPEWRLKIVGAGPLEDTIRNKFDSARNIEFLGYHTGKDLFSLVKNAKFVCVPSEWYENNPMTIIESYSLGTPVIGSNIGGIPEIIDDGNTGFLFKPGDELSLEKTVQDAYSLTNSRYKVLCSNAYSFYQNYFSAENYYKKLIDFYCDLL